MPVSLEVAFTLAKDSGLGLAAVERLAEDVELAVQGIGELVAWDLEGLAGLLILGGAESDEARLLATVRTHLLAAPGIFADHADVVVWSGEVELSRRQVRVL